MCSEYEENVLSPFFVHYPESIRRGRTIHFLLSLVLCGNIWNLAGLTELVILLSAFRTSLKFTEWKYLYRALQCKKLSKQFSVQSLLSLSSSMLATHNLKLGQAKLEHPRTAEFCLLFFLCAIKFDFKNKILEAWGSGVDRIRNRCRNRCKTFGLCTWF